LVVAAAAVLRLIWTWSTELGFNVYGCHITGTPVFNQALAETLGTAIKSAFTTNLAPVCPSNTQLTRVGIRDIRAANQSEFRDSQPGVGGTEAAVDQLPPSVAAVVTLRTGLTGRSFRGRSYISGFSEAQNGPNGTSLTAANTAAVNFVTAINTALQASGMELGVLSRPSFRQTNTQTTFDSTGAVLETRTHTHNARAGTITRVTAVEARDLLWQSQRRRTNGRGGTAPAAFGAIAGHTF
jgi:hypothetical protein